MSYPPESVPPTGSALNPWALKKSLETQNFESLKGCVLDGKYQILDKVSAGGMGAIFKAHHLQLNIVVAVKVSLDNTDANRALRFQREAAAMTKIRHPGVVAILDAGIAQNIPYIVMDHIAGEDLKSHVRSLFHETGRGLDTERALEILGKVAEALEACHEQGILHRDLKPANILLRHKDSQPVLVDFGLAQLRGQSRHAGSHNLTQTGQILGTPQYMAPEQTEDHSSEAVSEATDVWGLAATLCFCLTGEAPYPNMSPVAFYKALMTDEPRRIKDLNRDVDTATDEFCAQCLHKDPSQRPSMADFVDFCQDRGQASETRAGNWIAVGAVLLLCGLVLGVALWPRSRELGPIFVTLPRVLEPTNKDTATVRGQLGPQVLEASINDQSLLLTDGRFEAQVPLTEGENQLQVSVKTARGKVHQRRLKVFRDSTAPRIELENADGGRVTLDSSRLIQGRIHDRSTVTATAFGQQALALTATGQFTFKLPKDKRGQRLTISAEDALGNRGSQSWDVIMPLSPKERYELVREYMATEKLLVLAEQKPESKSELLTQAVTLLTPLIARYPDNFQLLYRLGRSYMGLGKAEQALKTLEQALAAKQLWGLAKATTTETYNTYRMLGELCIWDLKRHAQSIEYYTKALSLRPTLIVKDAGPLTNRGICYKELGEFQKALKDLRAAIKLNPGAEDAHFAKFEVHKILGDFDQALKEIETCVKLKPRNAHRLGHYKQFKKQRGIKD